MPKEREVSYVLKRFAKEGWILASGKGSHIVARKDGRQISIPTARRELAMGTYRSIAKVAGWLP